MMNGVLMNRRVGKGGQDAAFLAQRKTRRAHAAGADRVGTAGLALQSNSNTGAAFAHPTRLA
jgi:hypothetical protein